MGRELRKALTVLVAFCAFTIPTTMVVLWTAPWWGKCLALLGWGLYGTLSHQISETSNHQDKLMLLLAKQAEERDNMRPTPDCAARDRSLFG